MTSKRHDPMSKDSQLDPSAGLIGPSPEPAPPADSPDGSEQYRPKKSRTRIGNGMRKARRERALIDRRSGKQLASEIDERLVDFYYAEDRKDRKAGVVRTEEDRWQAARAELLRARADFALFDREWNKLAPISGDPDRTPLVEEVETAAVLRLPWMRWLWNHVNDQQGSGRRTDRTKVASVLFRMASAIKGAPDVLNTFKEFSNSNALLAWAFDYPTDKTKQSSVYALLHSMLERHNPDVVEHVNIEIIRRLAEVVDPPESQRGRRLVTGQHLIFDGCLFQADIEQVKPGSDEYRDLMRGSKRRKAGYVIYRGADGTVTTRVHGYKLCVITDLATNRPLVWMVIPSQGSERDALRALLAKLFELWPDCPAETITADAHLDNDETLSYDLEFKWGLHPCFPMHGKAGTEHVWHETDGVPTCRHGLMKLEKWDHVYDAKKRAKHVNRDGSIGLARGVQAPRDDAHARWECAKGLGCRENTYIRNNARLYTYLPRRGIHRLTAVRGALLARRNGVEHCFAALKHLGLGLDNQMRARWAGDEETVWLMGLGMLWLTARRYIHETGAYAVACAEAAELDLLTQPTLENPAPGPTRDELDAVRCEREDVVEAPRTWIDDHARSDWVYIELKDPPKTAEPDTD